MIKSNARKDSLFTWEGDMLKEALVFASIPVVDLEEAKAFYGETLGLTLAETPHETVAIYEGGKGTRLLVYSRPTPTKADHTAVGFMVSDLEAAVDDLAAKGVEFERYDLPGVTFDERGIASMGPNRTAWFKDPAGNTLSLNA